MFKVEINPSTGEIVRISDNRKVGIIKKFNATDFIKYPHTLRKMTIQLDSGESAILVYGGISNGKLTETCHLMCKWGKSCLSYKRGNCIHSPKLDNIGFYII